ncbi:MAG: hypothetical protein L6R37_002195 [Teloschistes peruensis]|nr:MAG: hypothetical protein L6R37_002195 [Teloschistes peruensis]
MYQTSKPHRLDRPPFISQRSSSISTDRVSLSVATLPVPPAVKPDPAYIAPATASHIVTGDYEPPHQEEGEPEEPTAARVNVTVAPNALYLINAFLDQLLYSFLASAQSTAIVSLRPAITEVLKPRLAKDAIASADEELNDFLGVGEDEEPSAFHYGVENKGEWHLNTIWRRTRLRCMVYTRLGDLEEEDEDLWIERENAEHKVTGQHRLSRDLGVVTPAAAIFLTSILEFIGEQALLVSAEAAYARIESRRYQERQNLPSVVGAWPSSVEVVDIEKLALSTTFGRLWRSWKKRVRSPSMTSPRPHSREFFQPASSHSASRPRSRHASIGEADEFDPGPGALQTPANTEELEGIREASAVPLPSASDNQSKEGESEFLTPAPTQDRKERPYSELSAFDFNRIASQANGAYTVHSPSSRPGLLQHNRSSSLPHLANQQYLFSHESHFWNPREGKFRLPFEKGPGDSSHDEADRAVVTKMYDGTLEEGEKDSSKHRAVENAGLPRQRTSWKETQDLDHGLESFGETSSEIGPPGGEYSVDRPSSEEMVANQGSNFSSQSPNAVHIAPAISHVAGPPDTTSDKPSEGSGMESGLLPKETQGYSHEDAFLNKRETLPKKRQSKNVPDPLILQDGSGAVPYNNRDQFDGATASRLLGGQSDSNSRPDADAGATADYPSPTYRSLENKVPGKISITRKQLPPVSTTVERATLQRVSPSPGGALESPIGRTSTSSSRDIRPIYTSSSNASQKASKSKSLAGRESSDTSGPFGVERTSSEGSVNHVLQRSGVDDTQRSFEQLIKSDETIQYTLTPQSVREMDLPDSPRYSHSRAGTADLADFIRTSGPPQSEMGRPPTSRSIISLKGLNGIRSNATASSKPAPTSASASILEKPEAQTQHSRPATAKSIQGAPREAQLGAETTRDFADFIRSTGPKEGPGSDITIKAASPATDTFRSTRPTTSGHRSVSGTSTGRKITKPNPSLSKSPPPVAQIAPPKRTSSKLQAREATYQPTHNEDLLDFLKQGPADSRINEKRPVPGPVASVVPQNPRIPNNTHPRQIDNTRSSVASTHDSSFAERSIHSTNSRTGLLDSPKGTFGGSPQSSQRQMPSFDRAPSQQPRKQRRVKDPYAIDTDSEDDDRPRTPKPQKQEESLIDFLNSTAPPSEAPKVPSAFDDIPDLSIRSPKNIQVNGNQSRGTYIPRNTARTAPTPAPAPQLPRYLAHFHQHV